MRVFVGYDPREAAALGVCVKSMRKHASVPLDITSLDLEWLRQGGLYTRPHEMRAGRLWDVLSNEPMSTEFSLSRFLVPYLCEFQGWALYVDCDFVFRADVAELFALAEEQYAAMVVRHHYIVRSEDKMEGQLNIAYPRKNWSSLVLFNCAHPCNRALNLHNVNNWQRRQLHAFAWLFDHEIGTLPFEWNWIELEPKAVHFTHGTPDMYGYENAAYADEYRKYL